MSFSRLNYDSCAYDKAVVQSTAVGDYMLNAPKNMPSGFIASPYVRAEKNQVATCKDRTLVDIDSELLGLMRTKTKCEESKMPKCELNTLETCVNDRFISAEDTKLSNPPCTLRGTGWNRWEWLCENPQAHAVVPFETMISDKTLAKDNHRALLPNTSDSTNELSDDMSCYTENPSMSFPAYGEVTEEEGEDIPLVHWRSCGEIRKY